MFQKSCVVLVVLCSLVLLPVATQGQIVNFNFTMDGVQANAGAGTGSAGIGTAMVSLDTNTNLLDWNIGWSGLTGNPTAMHFHGPALAGVNAGVQVGIGVTNNPMIGNATISASQANDLVAGLWYANLHTDFAPGGEIRGQVVPEPLTLSLFGLGSAMLIRRRQRRNR